MYSLLHVLKSIFDLFCETTALISAFQRIIETLEGMKEGMKINGIKCDTCNEVYNIEPTRVGELPLGWFMLTKGSSGLVEQPMHFCSLECLRLWLPRHPVASEFVGQDEEPKVTLSDRVY